MNIKEYNKLIQSHLTQVSITKSGKLVYDNLYYWEDTIIQSALVMKTKVGGAEGGGWQDNNVAKDYVEADPERQEETLDIVLGLVAPEITYLQYKKLVKELITEDTYQENDYYGNHTKYKVEMIHPDRLYNYLKEHVWKTLYAS